MIKADLLTVGLVVLGITFLFLMPLSMEKSWKNIGHKPAAGEGVAFLMRILGAIILILATLLGTGTIPVGQITGDPVKPPIAGR